MRWHRKKPSPKDDPRQALLNLTPEMMQKDADRRAWLAEQEKPKRPASSRPEKPPTNRR
jgi:hypothetical protein